MKFVKRKATSAKINHTVSNLNQLKESFLNDVSTVEMEKYRESRPMSPSLHISTCLGHHSLSKALVHGADNYTVCKEHHITICRDCSKYIGDEKPASWKILKDKSRVLSTASLKKTISMYACYPPTLQLFPNNSMPYLFVDMVACRLQQAISNSSIFKIND